MSTLALLYATQSCQNRSNDVDFSRQSSVRIAPPATPSPTTPSPTTEAIEITSTSARTARSEQWRVELAAAFGSLRTEAIGGPAASARSWGAPEGRIRTTSLGRVGAFLVAGTPQIVRRTAASILDAPADPLKVCIPRTGRAVVHQYDVEIEVRPGELALYDTGRPYELRLEGDWTCSVMTIPRDALSLPEQMVRTAMTHAFQSGIGPGAVLAHLLNSSIGEQALGADQLGEAGVLLMASLLRRTDTAEPPTADAVRIQVLAYIDAHLAEPDLSHASIAAAHRMSSRTLHRLFQAESHSVTETVRSMRLDAVRRDLVDPICSRRSTMAIASRWGFKDQSHFTRTFRSRFGVTPAAVRHEAHAR